MPLSHLLSRPTAVLSVRWGAVVFTGFLSALLALLLLAGCGPSVNRYLLIETSLRAHDPKGADVILQQLEKEYGEKNLVLYGMDRGMILQLAGDYQQSNAVLEGAEEELDRLYTSKIRTETLAFLTNDTALPYVGEPYEQVLLNVLKALNYAQLGEWQGALVESRRIDHRLNVLSDQASAANAYRDDGFARYLSGIFYESTGDVNNAFIAYRNAYKIFQTTRGWSQVAVPSQLRIDLLRTAEALQFTQDLATYQQAFPETKWETQEVLQPLAHVVVISYNGLAPFKEDQFFDLPISLDALQLMRLNRQRKASALDAKKTTANNTQISRAKGQKQRSQQIEDSVEDRVLDGLGGQVVRVALPRLVSQKTLVPIDPVSLIGENGVRVTVNMELAHDGTALAEKALSERMASITVKALSRAATKLALAEIAALGAQAAAGKDAGPLVGLLVGGLAKALARASEKADKRSWQTLPDEIHLARVWVPAGSYQVQSQPAGSNDPLRPQTMRTLSLRPGETTVLIQRVIP